MDDGLFWFLILGGIVVTLVGGFLLLRQIRRAQPPRVTKATRHTSNTVEHEDEAGQLDYVADFTPATTGKNATPASLVVNLPCEMAGEFTILRITSFDRFGKNVGIAKPVRTSGGSFDETFYIQTDTPDFCRAYFADPKRRDAVRELFDLGFQRLDADGHLLTATYRPYPGGEDESDDVARDAARAMRPLARSVPHQPSTLMTRGRKPLSRHRLQWVSWVTGFGLLALLIYLGVSMYTNSFPLDHWGLIFTTLPYVALALAVFLAWGYWLVRGHSTSHVQFRALVAAGVLLFPPFAVALTYNLNWMLDASPPTERVVRVVETKVTRSKNKSTYYAAFEWPQDRARRIWLDVGPTNFGRIRPNGTDLKLTTRAGWLGFEYIEAFAIPNP